MDTSEETPAPRGPWSYVKTAALGGRRFDLVVFILAWAALQACVPSLWATHLRKLTGHSALPHYWGERLTARELHEILVNGGLQQAWTGFWTPCIAILLFLLIIWFGWRIQAASAGVKARWTPWGLGLVDALVIGIIPLGLVAWCLSEGLLFLSDTGIQGLGWLALVGRFLILPCLGATLMLQWWICRMSRAVEPALSLPRRLLEGFLCLWSYPVQWGTLILGSVIIRLLVQGLPLLLGWRWGGGNTSSVWGLLLLQILAAAINAWIITWFIRLAAHHWRNTNQIQRTICDLKRDFSHPPEAGSNI